MYGGIAWVIFAFVAGVVLVSTPKSGQDVPRDSAPSVSSQTPSYPTKDSNNSAKTKVNVQGTVGSEGTATTKVNVTR